MNKLGFWKLSIYYTKTCEIVVKILKESFTYEDIGSDAGDRLCGVKTVCVEITEVLRSLSCLRDNFREQLCEK